MTFLNIMKANQDHMIINPQESIRFLSAYSV